MNKNLLIIPGFGESATDSAYKTIKNQYNKKYNVINFVPKWNYNVPSNWLAELRHVLSVIDTKNTTVVCFSFGAYITLLSAAETRFEKIIFCSISPFYKEQLSMMPEAAKAYFGKRRVKDFYQHSIPKSIHNSPAVFLFGSEDWPYAIREAKKLAKKYHGEFRIIENTHHELSENYIKVIATFI